MERTFPKFLSIQTTSFCNGRCVFCPYDEIKDLFPRKIMDDHLFKKIINECHRHREIERIILYLNNEPLTDPSLIKRINYAKEKVPWASVHILTNGSLLSNKLADELIDSKLDWIGFSLHGIRQETIEKAMGIDYESTIERIINFIEKAKVKKNIEDFIMVTFLRHKYLTLKEKEQTMRFWREKGIERISYFDGPISRAGNVKGLPQVRHKKIKGCTTIWANEMIHIVENGDVVLCCMDWRREVILGNINKQSIYQVWDSQIYRDARDRRDGRKDSDDDFICKKCEAAIVEEGTEEAARVVALRKNKEEALDILLAICPVWGVNMPPPGLASIAAYLKSKRIKLKVLDFNIEIFSNAEITLKKFWEISYGENWDDYAFFTKMKNRLEQEIEHAVDEILSFDCDLLGFSIYASNRLFSIEIIRRIKSRCPQKIVIAGGRGVATPEERQIFPEGTVDYFCVGEGEGPLAGFVQRLKAKQDFDDLQGIISFQNRSQALKPYITENLDSLPLVSYAEFNLDKYKGKSLALLMSRGCISRCAFCDDWRLMGRYRIRRAERMIEEIKYGVQQHKITNFYFNDPAVNGIPNELERLCELIIQNNLKITWIAPAIPLGKMSLDLLKKMRQAGCLTLIYGVESGSDKVLRSMRKLFSSAEAERVLRDTRLAGINTQVNFIFGFPGEGEEEFQETIEFIKRNKDYICGISSINACNATVGSDLSYQSRSYGIVFPQDAWLRDSRWVSPGNTYQIRQARTLKAISLLKQFKISIFTTNVFAKEKKDDVDILLVILPPWGVETPPLGIACLSTFLRNRGLNTELFDFNVYLYNKAAEQHKYLWEMGSANYWRKEEAFKTLFSLFRKEIDFCVEKIISSGAQIVGFSVLSNSQDRITARIIQQVKEKAPEIKIILGGTSVSVPEQRAVFQEQIKDLVEAYVIGEGEETLCELFQAIKSGKATESVPGVLIDRNGKYIYSPRNLKKDLDTYPFPNFDGFDLENYLNKNKGLIMEWTRGCTGHCVFCAFKTISSQFRKKSPESIVRAIEYYAREFGAEHFSLVDSAINGDLKCLEQVCDLLIKKNLNVKFSCLALPRRDMNYRLLRKMKKAGFIRIEYGVESGSDKVLQAMGKVYSSKDAENAIKATHQAGIMTVIYLIVGFPEEGEVEFGDTIKFLNRNTQYIDLVKSVNPLYLMAGSPIYKNYKMYGITLPEVDPDFKWFIGKENTYEIRLQRVRKIRSVLNQIDVRYFADDDMFERKTDLKKLELNEKVLLVLCPMWDINWPPLGISYLASSLENKGFSTDILDINIETYAKSDYKRKALWKMQSYFSCFCEDLFEETMQYFEEDMNYYVQKILRAGYKIIGFSLYGANILFSIKLATLLKERNPDLFIIFGGPSCWFLHNDPVMPIRYMVSLKTKESFIRPGVVDAFVLGEGEETLPELICGYLSDNIQPIPGTVIFSGGEYIVSPARAPILNLDKLPYPAWEKLPLDLYYLKNHLPILFSRGCINKCAFCIDWIIWQEKYRCRSALNIFEEMKIMQKKFNRNTFQCNDLLFNGSLKMLKELADYLIGSNLNIHWNAQGVIRKDMGLVLLETLKKSGLHRITYGVESLSDNVIRAMSKGYSFRDTQKVLMDTRKAGIVTAMNLIVGFPNESKEDFNITKSRLALIREHLDTVGALNPCSIMSGSFLERFPQKFSITNYPHRENRWEGLGGENTHEIREKRVKEMAEFVRSIGMEVEFIGLSDKKDSLDLLKGLSGEKTKIRIFKKHHPLKFILLGALFIYTLFYITYFWIFKKLKGRSLLGGN